VASSRDQGFVREVISTTEQDGSLVMNTKEASLSDAVLTGGSPEAVPLPDLSGLAGGFSFSNFSLLSGTINARVVDGAMAFAPELNVDLHMQDRAVDYFRVAAKGTLTANLVLDVSANVTASENVEKVVWESPKQFFVQWIGPVPVVEAVSVVASVGINVSATGAGSARIGGTFRGSVEAGAKYDGQWHPIGEQSMQFTPTALPTSASANIKMRAYVTTKLKVDFYGIAGPYIAVTPYIALEGNSSGQFAATYGASGNFGGSATIGNVPLPAFSQQLFSFSNSF
jgi:hypothetical protein